MKKKAAVVAATLAAGFALTALSVAPASAHGDYVERLGTGSSQQASGLAAVGACPAVNWDKVKVEDYWVDESGVHYTLINCGVTHSELS